MYTKINQTAVKPSFSCHEFVHQDHSKLEKLVEDDDTELEPLPEEDESETDHISKTLV